MSAYGIPEDVEQFIRKHLTSVAQLETLLLLRRRGTQRWTATAVSRELGVEPATTAENLAELEARGFLVGSARGYVYDRLQRDEVTIDRLAAAYAECASVIIALVKRERDQVRTLSDAFRLKLR